MEGHDSESYWNRSTSQAFSFEEDDDESSTGNERGGGAGIKWAREADILGDDSLSEASFGNGIAGGVLNLSIKSVISDDALKLLLQEQTLEERILPKGVTSEEELRLLRRQVQTTLYNPSAEATAIKLLLGKRVPLEMFKSLDEKQQLLDTVLANGGGDAIIAVLLFLQKSLNRANFYKVLQTHPRAMQHYISFLEQRQTSDAVVLLRHFGSHQEAALLEFNVALAAEEVTTRKHLLHQLLEGSGCAGVGSAVPLGVYTQHFLTSLQLLELIEKERHALDNMVEARATPVEVLWACCRKHNNWKEQQLERSISPYRLAAEQHIAAAQFEWTALNERSAAQAYADLESVFERMPTWHPIKLKQFHISFALELAIMRLFELQAPASVLYLFLSKISSSSEKLELAQRVKCTRAIIDALVAAKEIGQLTRLKETLPERSEEQFYCDKALKALQNKRWSTDNIKLKL